jgi:hypothetical protein
MSTQDSGIFTTLDFVPEVGVTSYSFWIQLGVHPTGTTADTVTFDIGRCFFGPVTA